MYIVEEPRGSNSIFDILVCSPTGWGPEAALLNYHCIGEEDLESLNTFYDEEGEEIYDSDS